MSTLRFSLADVHGFAAATGDRNPAHVDPLYARRTPSGAPVVHGALVAAALLARLGAAAARVDEVSVTFHHPVRPGQAYRVNVEPGLLTARLGPVPVCVVRYRLAPDPIPAEVLAGRPPEGPPRVLDAAALGELGPEAATYAADGQALTAAIGPLSGHLLGALAWASFWVGMRTPGEAALWCGLRVSFPASSDPPPGLPPGHMCARVETPKLDRRTGLLTFDARLAGAVAARLAISAQCRPAVPLSTRHSVLPYAGSAPRLEGRLVAVLGGSRGLGRAISLHLALRGAQVLVVSRQASEMERAQVPEILTADVDIADGERLAERLAALPGRLDGLVLCAAPPIPALPLDADAAEAGAGYVAEAVRQCWTALGVAAERLHEDAFVVLVSSSALIEPPRLWPHYVAAMAARESLAAHLAAGRERRVLVARPPRLWTERTNTLTGRLGAVPVEAVADWIMRAVDRAGPARLPQLLTWQPDPKEAP